MKTSIIELTAAYEKWLGRELTIIPEDLAAKHKAMAADIFSFLRATFYGWSKLFPQVCPSSASAPALLAVGDLHVENFGTWRDAEGRLVWGINDFDEATRMPYTIDLVRLAASAHIAIDTEKLRIAHRDACVAVLTGTARASKPAGAPG